MQAISGLQAVRDRVVQLSGKPNPTVRDFVEEPHAAIVGGHAGTITNLVDRRARPAQDALLAITREDPERTLAEARRLVLPSHHDVRPADVDVALIYDNFSPYVIMQLEDYGFAPIGEGGRFVADGNIRWKSGSIPVNTHGGNLSEAYVMGMTHVREAVEQLRGTAVNQVDGAEIALVTGGTSLLPMSGTLLRRA